MTPQQKVIPISTSLLNRYGQLRFTCTAIMCSLITSLLLIAPLTYAQEPSRYLAIPMENDQGESFRPADINNAGLVALGKYSNPHLYVYVPNTRGLMYDINSLAGAEWEDLETGIRYDETDKPWVADSATGVNESNQIVGTAKDTGGTERVYVLEDPLGATPVFHVLPRFGSGVRGVAINDDGVAVGVAEGAVVVFDPRSQPVAYLSVDIPAPVSPNGVDEPHAINNLGDIVTRTGHIISPAGSNSDGSLDYFEASIHYYEGLQFFGINDARQIAGTQYATGRGRNRQSGGEFRFQYNPEAADVDNRLVADPLIIESAGDYFSDVNARGDVAFTYEGRPYVYLEDHDDPGPYGIDQLVEFDSIDDEAKWLDIGRAQANGINDRGQIIARNGFLLTPIVSGPGITVTPTADLTTTEDGGTDFFEVSLDTEPTAAVTIGLTIDADDADEGTIDKTILTFTAEDWSIAQRVTVTGLDDDQVDGDVTYTIYTAPAVSDDPAYDGLDAADVSVTNVDNDGQSGGGSETYASGVINEEIADNTSTQFELVAASHQITTLTVNVNITHPRPEDLLVFLIGPEGGEPVRLLNLTGDNPIANFNGTNSLGVWTLDIHDIEAGPGSRRRPKTGTLNSWSIAVEY